MDRDTDLFVQAFWVRCRETIRPELDLTVDDLRGQGHEAHVATQEYSDVPDQLPDAGPALILTVHPKGRPEGHTLRFRGEVALNTVAVIGSPGTTHHHDLDDLELPVVKAEIAAWLADLLGKRA